MKTQPNFRFLSIFIILLGLAISWSCQKDDPTPPASTEKTISALSFEGVVQGASVDIQGTNITVTVPYGTDITALAPTITLPKGATISPASGVKQDFTKPVTYTVTAEDGSKQTFTVTVTQGLAPKSTAKEIKSFIFRSFSPVISATIDSTAKTITATLPATADLSKLAPEVTLSPKATVSPASGVAQDFSKDVTYTVTAEDGSTKAFVVLVKKETGEVAVNPNDLPDFNGCLIKRVKLYDPSFPDKGSIVLEYKYKNKNLDEVVSTEMSKYIQAGQEKISIYTHTNYFKYKNSKLSNITNEKGSEIYKIFYTSNGIIDYVNYSKGTISASQSLDFLHRYENQLIKKIHIKGTKADTIGIINYDYDSRKNISKIFGSNDKIGFSFEYDNKKNTYNNLILLYGEEMYNLVLELYGDVPLFIYQNANNTTRIKYTDEKNEIAILNFNYNSYNSAGYPLRATLSSNAKEYDFENFVIDFEYYCK